MLLFKIVNKQFKNILLNNLSVMNNNKVLSVLQVNTRKKQNEERRFLKKKFLKYISISTSLQIAKDPDKGPKVTKVVSTLRL